MTGVDRGERWVAPWWLERQLDPGSPDVVVAPDAPPHNRTHRSWTTLGTIGSPARGVVDPRGLVSVAGGWSLDWWVGTGERWRYPSREPGVRQQLVEGSPVVETALRVTGGDVVHRTCGVQSTGSAGDEPHLLVEIENRGAVAVVLALAVRPGGPAATGAVTTIEHDATEVRVDGRTALLLPKAPALVALGDAAGGDLADVVAAEAAEVRSSGSVTCPEGRAQAAFLFPLPHTATLRVAVPLAPPAPRRRGAAPAPRTMPDLPDAARVAKGWDVHARRGTRVVLPAGRLADVVESARRSLLLAASSEDLGAWPAPDFRFHDAALVVAAADLWGFADEAGALVATWGERQALDGWFGDHEGRIDATGAALWAVGTHWRHTRDRDLVDDLLGPLAKGVHAVGKRRSGRRRDPRAPGLLSAGPGPRWVAPGEAPVFHDSFWSWAGLLAVAEAMDGIDQPDVAAEARRVASAIAGDVGALVERSGSPVLAAGPGRRIDGGVVANLAACDPLGVLDVDDPRARATLDAVRDRYTSGPAVVEAVGPAGLNPMLTAFLAGAEAVAGDPRALERLAWLVTSASPVHSWPEVIHPRTGGGSVGDGHHAATTAAVLRLVRQLLVRDTAEGLALCSALPEGWEGQGIEVHEAPTARGALSFALRWHGERPAVLWELSPHPGVDGDALVLTAPGLDRAWRGTGARGEALLAPFVRPVPAADGSEVAAEPGVTPVEVRRATPDQPPAAESPAAESPAAESPAAESRAAEPPPPDGGSFS